MADGEDEIPPRPTTGPTTQPQFKGEDLPGLSFDVRSGNYWNPIDGRPATAADISEARARKNLETLNATRAKDEASARDTRETADIKRIPSQSISTSQSFADPATLDVQWAQLEQTKQTLQETIRGNLAEEASKAQLMRFNQDKLRVETETGDKNRALQTQQLIQSQQEYLGNLQMKRAEMVQQLQLADQQQQQRAQDRALAAYEGVQSRALTRAGQEEQAYQSERADKLQRDTAIANFSASPGDVGRVSALLNRGGFSPVSTAIGSGETAITDQSLETLGNLMQVPERRPSAPPEDMSQLLALINPPTPPLAASAPAPYQGGGGTLVSGSAPPAAPPADIAGAQQQAIAREEANQRMKAAGVPDFVPGFKDGGAVVEPGVLEGLMAIVKALGLEPKAVAGERGEASGETVYGEPGSNVVVMPDKGKGGRGKPKAATGTAIGPGFTLPPAYAGQTVAGDTGGVPGLSASPAAPTSSGGLPSLIDLARQFMSNTQRTTMQRSGFGTTPTPVSLADPGVSNFRRQLGASTAATMTGFPAATFLEELMRAIPRGQQYGMGGRTR